MSDAVDAEADLSTTVAGVRLPFPAMNAAGTATRMDELRALARSNTGAIVLGTATVHPFLHPEFRSLHNPGFDKLVPMAKDLVTLGGKPVIASIAGTNADEFALLGAAFAEAGASIIEANLAEPYIAAVHQPFDEPGRVRELLAKLAVSCPVPVAVKVPFPMPIGVGGLADELSAVGLRLVVIKNDFTAFEKFQLAADESFEVIALGGVNSGYDLTRTLAKGARAVQLEAAQLREGFAMFGRLAREMQRSWADKRR